MTQPRRYRLVSICLLLSLPVVAQEAEETAADPIVGVWAPAEDPTSAMRFGPDGTVGPVDYVEGEQETRCRAGGFGEAVDQCAQGRWTAGEGGAYTLDIPMLESAEGPDPGQIGCTCNVGSITAQLTGEALTVTMGAESIALQRQADAPTAAE